MLPDIVTCWVISVLPGFRKYTNCGNFCLTRWATNLKTIFLKFYHSPSANSCFFHKTAVKQIYLNIITSTSLYKLLFVNFRFRKFQFIPHKSSWSNIFCLCQQGQCKISLAVLLFLCITLSPVRVLLSGCIMFVLNL